MSKEIVVTDDNFEQEVLKSDKPVLVDFWATWCGPCQMIAPAIEEIAEEFDGKVKVCKLNTDENIKIPAKYCINAIPTIMFFKNCQVVDQSRGFVGKKVIADKINKLL